MTSIRNALVLLGLTAAVVVGAVATPASAPRSPIRSRSRRRSAPHGRRRRPTWSGKLNCGPGRRCRRPGREHHGPGQGLRAHVYFSDGFVQTVPLGPTATSWSDTIDKYYVTAYSIQYSVTTSTDYGWIQEIDAAPPPSSADRRS